MQYKPDLKRVAYLWKQNLELQMNAKEEERPIQATFFSPQAAQR